MRVALFVALFAAFPAALWAQEQQPAPVPAGSERFERFLDAAIRSPFPYAWAFGGGVLDELSSYPGEWTGVGGFGKRYAARLGQGFAGDSIGHAAAAVLHHKVAFERCTCSGTWNRTKHAVARAFYSERDGGGRSPNWSLWLSKYTAAGLANAWYPKSYTKGTVFWQATGGIGISAGLNVAREFLGIR